MCNLSKGVEENGIRKGFALGIEQGLEQGIQVLVSTLQGLLFDQASVAKTLAEKFDLPFETASEKVRQYWKS